MEFHKERDPVKTARDALKTVSQKGSVLQHAHRLEEIYLSLPDHSEDAKIHDFVYVRKPNINKAFQLAKPKTFVQAV